MIFRSTFNRPILLAGNGVRTANAVDMLHTLARKTNIPLLTTMNAVDIAQDDLHIGFIGTHGNRVANMIISECDFLISVGARLGIRQVGRFSDHFAPKAELVRVDIDEYELSRNVKYGERKFQTDARDFLRLLLDENIPDYSHWNSCCRKARDFLSAYDKQEGNYAVEKLSSFLPPNPVVAVDVGQHQCWAAQSLHLKGDYGRIHISGGYGTMGCSLPFAIGASIANNGGPVYCVSGDGGFQMNIQELETIKREKLPIKIFVFNNHVLGKISETQHFNHNDRYANTTLSSGYSVPDFCKIAKAYGIKAERLDSYRDLDAFSNWILDSEPCLLDISLPEDSFLTPKINFITGMTNPELPAEITEKARYLLME